jgi:hypothetical protein
MACGGQRTARPTRRRNRLFRELDAALNERRHHSFLIAGFKVQA